MAQAGSTSNMHNLTTLIKRLEAATSRLEDIASSVDGETASGMAGAVRDASPVPHMTNSNAIMTPTPTSQTKVHEPAPEPESIPAAIQDFDEFVDNEVAAFVDLSTKVGSLVEEQAQSVQQAFKAERMFLLMSTKAKKPEPMRPDLFADIHRFMSQVDEIKDTNRGSEYFKHLAAVSEGIVALGWIMETRPADFVDSALSGAQYNGNTVLRTYKEKDENHVKYIQAYYKLLRALSEYIKKHYKMGLTWNNKDGVDASEALTNLKSGKSLAGSGTATPKANAGPPPPPPPPLPKLDDSGNLVAPGGVANSTAKGGDMTAVFGQLNQGSAVTSGLRKVDKSEMTHKNPSLRAAAAAVPQRQGSNSSSSGRGKSPMPGPKPDSLKSKKPSRKELDGTKWIVENFDSTGTDVIEITAEMNQTVLISKCSKCVVKINNKANAISVDNCAGLSLLVDSLVSSIDVIKSSKFAVQVDGALPTILMDQVDGAQIYLQETSMKSPPEIITSKCSAINVVTPPTNEQDDSKETALPEQLRSYFKNGKLVTEVVEHAG